LNSGQAVSTGWKQVGARDFNANGQKDLLWQHLDGRIALWLMNGVTRVSTVLY
jgi:hypothetical protein